MGLVDSSRRYRGNDNDQEVLSTSWAKAALVEFAFHTLEDWEW